MRLVNKNILLISPEPWDHLFVSKHHYAIELCRKGNQVFFLNPPNGEFSVRKTKYENLSVIDYKGFVKGLYYYPKWIRKREVSKVFRKLERLSQCKFDILWSFDNSVFFDLDTLSKEVLKISHIVDLNQDFQTARAATSANICFGVIPSIVDRLKQYNNYSFLIPHGVELHLKEISRVHLPGEKKKKALYFGNLAMPHLNWLLLKKALETFTEVDFILLGSHHDKVPLDGYSNLHLLQPVEASHLSDYMAAVDTLFLFYSAEYLTSYASPHKLLEYFSSGKPVVSNAFPEYDKYGDLIYQANNDKEWLTNFSMAITETDPQKSKQRIDIALANTYEHRIGEIEQLLNTLR